MKIDANQAEDISSQVFGRYQYGFIWKGYSWSDIDEGWRMGVPKIGAISAPDKKPRMRRTIFGMKEVNEQ